MWCLKVDGRIDDVVGERGGELQHARVVLSTAPSKRSVYNFTCFLTSVSTSKDEYLPKWRVRLSPSARQTQARKVSGPSITKWTLSGPDISLCWTNMFRRRP